jgi:hypothetical protein
MIAIPSLRKQARSAQRFTVDTLQAEAAQPCIAASRWLAWLRALRPAARRDRQGIGRPALDQLPQVIPVAAIAASCCSIGQQEASKPRARDLHRLGLVLLAAMVFLGAWFTPMITELSVTNHRVIYKTGSSAATRSR